MVKRALTDDDSSRQPKRQKCHNKDRLSILSDELLLRSLSLLPVSTLTKCQRLSHRFYALAGDSQLWKSAFYNRFVRPRASRIPGIRDQSVPSASLLYSSRISKWLDDERLVRRGTETNWKRQYKLRHNWSRGTCKVSEIPIAQQPIHRGILVQLHDDVAITVDDFYGIRVWMIKGQQQLLADFHDPIWGLPTSLAIDNSEKDPNNLMISVGFNDGEFGVFMFKKKEKTIHCLYRHAASTNGTISAVSFARPYLVTMTESQLLSLYHFPLGSVDGRVDPVLDPPRLITSLRSHTARPPLTLSIRVSSTSIVVSIAYALPTYLTEWSVGLQELRLTPQGMITQSRLTSSMDQGFSPFKTPSHDSRSPSSDLDLSLRRSRNVISYSSITKPTSLSYSHPYLLASHPDNTLTLYLVSSSEEKLVVGQGSRLWGHTSSVSEVRVDDRGKAVSVSFHGHEIRVWELEGGIPSKSKRGKFIGEASVQVRPEGDSGLTLVGNTKVPAYQSSLAVNKGWVGFDEEKVVVLREKEEGSQALTVYDFS